MFSLRFPTEPLLTIPSPARRISGDVEKGVVRIGETVMERLTGFVFEVQNFINY
jgi:hypothetical protein